MIVSFSIGLIRIDDEMISSNRLERCVNRCVVAASRPVGRPAHLGEATTSRRSPSPGRGPSTSADRLGTPARWPRIVAYLRDTDALGVGRRRRGWRSVSYTHLR